jgi:hypothetical protein
MKAEYKGARFEGTPEEVTKAIELMKANEPTTTITYLPTVVDWYKWIPNAMDSQTFVLTPATLQMWNQSDSTYTATVRVLKNDGSAPGIGG